LEDVLLKAVAEAMLMFFWSLVPVAGVAVTAEIEIQICYSI
jgi:hypothetical protein